MNEQDQSKQWGRLAAIVFTDMVGSTQLKQQLGDREAAVLIKRHHALIREILGRIPEGEEIETAGDSFLILFAKPSDAARFALLVQSRLRQPSGPSVRICDRIGIHVGEVLCESGTELGRPKALSGIHVDACARVMSLAQGDQVLMTRFAFDSARSVLKGEDISGVGPLGWMNHGPYLLKGIEESVEICEVGEVGLAGLRAPANSEKAHRHISAEAEPVLGWRPALEQVVPNTKWTLEKKLGEGGFGEVWLGRHEALKESRVFKFCFRADRVRSLKREVTLFRLLKERVGHHKNIVGIQEVFFDAPPFYIVMDYAEGQDLRAWCDAQGGIERVPLATRLEIVAQVADALQAAHEAGVIHRDVKPSNILISRRSRRPFSGQSLPSDGGETGGEGAVQVKLTDFGIGQVVSEEALAGMTRMGFTQTMMGPGSSSHTGTQLYMAPELMAGQAASARSDIYSLGVVLYQLLIGDFTRPLTTDWAKRINDPLLREDLGKCFVGDPDERFARAELLANNLRSLDQRRAAVAARDKAAARRRLVRRTAVGFALVAAVCLLALFAFKQGGGRGREAPPVKLAVLPLVNLSGDVAQESFADEMTDDLIAKLGQISALRVIGRAPVMPYKQTTNSLPEIARRLKVDAVVRGTLKRERDKVQMGVWLFQGATDRQLWPTNRERDVGGVFALQNEAALAIASEMKVKLPPKEQARLAHAPVVSPEALDLYYRGKAKDLVGGDTNNKEAIGLLERAVGISKDFAPAWVALAGFCIRRFYQYEQENYRELEGKAQTAVLNALELDPSLAEAYVQHGRLYWNPGSNFQHDRALRLFYHALEFNSSSVEALNWISWVYNHTGFFDEALAKANEAQALDPLQPGVLESLACSQLWKGEYEQSRRLWPPPDRDVLPTLCGSHSAWALFALGRTNDAKAKLQGYLTQHPNDRPGELTAMNAVLLAAEGDAAGALEQLKKAEQKTKVHFGETHHATYFIACAYARLNKTAEALQWLRKTADTGFPCYPLFRDDPNLKSLHADAGFEAFLKEQETAWKKRKTDWAKFEDNRKSTGDK